MGGFFHDFFIRIRLYVLRISNFQDDFHPMTWKFGLNPEGGVWILKDRYQKWWIWFQGLWYLLAPPKLQGFDTVDSGVSSMSSFAVIFLWLTERMGKKIGLWLFQSPGWMICFFFVYFDFFSCWRVYSMSLWIEFGGTVSILRWNEWRQLFYFVYISCTTMGWGFWLSESDVYIYIYINLPLKREMLVFLRS